jgi:hypothetical protein
MKVAITDSAPPPFSPLVPTFDEEATADPLVGGMDATPREIWYKIEAVGGHGADGTPQGVSTVISTVATDFFSPSLLIQREQDYVLCLAHGARGRRIRRHRRDTSRQPSWTDH